MYSEKRASHLVRMSLVMLLISQHRSAVGMRVCRHCRSLVLENHRDNNSLMIRLDTRPSIVIYCPWANSIAQPSKNFGHLYRPTDPLCVVPGEAVRI